MHLASFITMDEKKMNRQVSRRNDVKFRTLYACINCRRRKVKVSGTPSWYVANFRLNLVSAV
jgi:hypothetical protein